ncbi:expressed unknown protein [Seminavis robusta]|uniref:Uncharacterized protein n=1 Tax=Seminavis robusta TaxID=568900 RepID=A0A9N8DI96_9STRA|nr:expressed unknown protein [Seminavis robusta]|eukprot:Sro100_g051410.1 n/a (370) ;mRNA; f:111466-112575
MALAELSVCVKQVKIVGRKLAVAHGFVVIVSASSAGQDDSDAVETCCLGFRNKEPCHVFVRSCSDVNRIQEYLQHSTTKNSNTPAPPFKSNGKTTGWHQFSNDDGTDEVCLRIKTVLTTAIERNRRGVKLIECSEVVSIDNGSSEFTVAPRQSSSSSPSSSQVFTMHDKSQRHVLFAQWLLDTYGKDFLSTGSGVLDVAGGNGELSRSLQQLGIPSVVLDPQPRLSIDHDPQPKIPVLKHALEGNGTHLLMTTTTEQERRVLKSASMIVGMHPDQATEPIIWFSQHLKVPFALLPCCVMPSLFPHRVYQGKHVRSYRLFCLYLQDLRPPIQDDDDDDTRSTESVIQTDYLPFMGRNMILYTSFTSFQKS